MLTRIGEARSALAGSEERLRLALEGSETGTWDWNLISGHATWDDYMFPLYGMDRAKWNHHPKGFLHVVHPDDRAEVERQIDDAIDKRRDVNIDFRIICPNGSVRHMASRGRVFRDAAGNPVRMSGVSMDVTEEKHSQEALQTAKDTAEAANRAKDEFLAILSHELRTPLSPVLTTLAMLEEDAATPAHLQRELEMIRRNVEVEARLIDDLLDITRITRGKLELHTTTVDVRSLLSHAVENYLRDEATRKHLTIKVDIDPNAATHIVADASRITQVLWNLLQNACKFTPEGGGIAIAVTNGPAPDSAGAQPELIITIKDTGIGIETEILPRIFDAFEQGERSRTRKFGGLGLGLAISRAIVSVHGGSLTATSPGKDQGATFTVRLPTTTAPVSAAASAAPSGPKPSDAPKLFTARILLVEDHADTAEQLARLLRRVGHQVITAGTLAEAHDRASVNPFDLLLSDLGLPDGNGHELMRDFAGRYGVPGIALSGYGMEEDVQESLAAGFSRHLTKPVNWAELKGAIQSLLAVIKK
jgi:PAS domain S-box-containing protein